MRAEVVRMSFSRSSIVLWVGLAACAPGESGNQTFTLAEQRNVLTAIEGRFASEDGAFELTLCPSRHPADEGICGSNCFVEASASGPLDCSYEQGRACGGCPQDLVTAPVRYTATGVSGGAYALISLGVVGDAQLAGENIEADGLLGGVFVRSFVRDGTQHYVEVCDVVDPSGTGVNCRRLNYLASPDCSALTGEGASDGGVSHDASASQDAS
jgi:hypothetical protein